MENKAIRNTAHKVVHGHEAWMEDYISHYHTGDPIMAMVKWGHNAQLDGSVALDIMDYKLCAPDGTITEVQSEIGGEDCFDLTSFDTYEEGYYTFIAEYEHCWAKYGERDEDYKFGDRKAFPDAMEVRNYLQYATLVVPVGHFGPTEMQPIPSMRLSILPDEGSGYMAEHSIEFHAVLDGKPLPNHDAVIIRLLDDGSTEELAVKSDEDGSVVFVPEKEGTYVIILRATDDTPDADGRYEGTSLTASLGFRVAEHNHDHHAHGDHHAEEHHHHHAADELLEDGECCCGHHHDHDHEHHHHHGEHHHHDHDCGCEHHHDHDHEHHHHH